MPQLDDNHISPSQSRGEGFPPAKKAGFLSRLFGSKPAVGGNLPKKEDFGKGLSGRSEAKGEPLKKPGSWEPLDFSDTRRIAWNKSFNNPRALQTHVKHDLKKSLGTMLSANQRVDVAKLVKQSRHHGLRAGEIVKGLDERVKEGSLSKFEAKKIRQSMRLKRGPGMF